MIKNVILYVVFILVSLALASLATYYRTLYIMRRSEENSGNNSESVSSDDTDSEKNKIASEESQMEQANKTEESQSEEFSDNIEISDKEKLNKSGELKENKSKLGFKESLKKSKAFFAICTACYVIIAVLGLLSHESKEITVLNLAQYTLLWDTMFIVASIDFKIKIIPNKLILFMLAVRILGIVVEIILYPSFWLTIILSSVVGLIVGGLFVLICYFISRGGIGVGDMKMFATIGFFFGLSGVLEIMMYSLFLSCIVSIVLLVSRKAKFKSSIPMAPFVFIGLSIYFLFL